MMQRCATAVLVAVLQLIFSTTLLGNDQTADAKVVFQKATELFSKGEYIAAAKEFRRANQIHPTWKILYNIGQCEAAAKRYGFAVDAFEAYLSQGGDEVTAERQEEVISELRRFKAKTGQLQITGPPGVAVRMDGVHIGVTPLPGKVRISAGVVHELEGMKDGKLFFKRSIKVSGEELENIQMEQNEAVPVETAAVSEETDTPPAKNTVAPKQPSSPPVSSKPVQHKSRLKTVGIITLATGVGAMIGGGVLGGMAISKDKQLEQECDSDYGCDETSASQIESGKKVSTASTVLFIAGGALATTGLILLIVNKKKNTEVQTVSLQPLLGPTVGIAGRF